MRRIALPCAMAGLVLFIQGCTQGGDPAQVPNPAPVSGGTPVSQVPPPSTQTPPSSPPPATTPAGNCNLVSEQITLTNQGTLSFPRSGLFTIEAHYLTTQDAASAASVTAGLAAHLATSCTIALGLGFSISSDCHELYPTSFKSWTPAEGGGQIGVGARSSYRPAPLEEMFQGNLYYASGQLPQPGTRYIVTNPANGRSIVASFGYEVGPADPKWLGGLTEEASYYLDQYSNDSSALEIGRAADQSLSFGPITCN